MAIVAKPSTKRPKRQKASSFAEELDSMASDIISRDDLTPDEKQRLKAWRGHLNHSIEALEQIIAAHDALQLGATDWSEPFDPYGKMLLNIALSAAFMISSHAMPNPIEARRVRENAAKATQARLDKSKKIDALITDAGSDLWSRHRGWSDERIAANILDEVNRKLEERKYRVLKTDAVRKRVHYLRINGRPSS